MKTYVTFGSSHNHKIDGKTFDETCVAVVDGDRAKVFELFGPAFCVEYSESEWDEKLLRYFRRGYVEVE